MKAKKLFSILVITMIAILMLTAVMSTVTAVDAASKKVKVTWNANGGKIGSSKITTTTVKKDAKIGKLPKTPKKSGYTFAGWYTKKSGGTKITTAIKVKKKVIYYAQWKKSSSKVLTTEEKKLVGTWENFWGTGGTLWTFREDGTFVQYSEFTLYNMNNKYQYKGSYSLKNGVLSGQIQSRWRTPSQLFWDGIPWTKLKPFNYNKIEFGTENGKQYVIIDEGTGIPSKYFKQ